MLFLLRQSIEMYMISQKFILAVPFLRTDANIAKNSSISLSANKFAISVDYYSFDQFLIKSFHSHSFYNKTLITCNFIHKYISTWVEHR